MWIPRKNGYTTAIAQKSPYPFAFAVDRTGGADKVRSYATRKNSPAVEAARSYLLNNQIADNYQKIFVVTGSGSGSKRLFLPVQ